MECGEKGGKRRRGILEKKWPTEEETMGKEKG